VITVTDTRDKTIHRLRQGLAEVITEHNKAMARIAELEALLTRVLRGEADAA